jgi:SHS2 domain-containing protein
VGTFEQIDHTADVALRLVAADEADLLGTGARAVVDLLTDAQPVAAHAERELHADGADAAERLVAFMNEVLVVALTEGFLPAELVVTVDGDDVHARARGEAGAFARVVNELKSVTYHDLEVKARDGGLEATVVIDV